MGGGGGLCVCVCMCVWCMCVCVCVCDKGKGKGGGGEALQYIFISDKFVYINIVCVLGVSCFFLLHYKMYPPSAHLREGTL